MTIKLTKHNVNRCQRFAFRGNVQLLMKRYQERID